MLHTWVELWRPLVAPFHDPVFWDSEDDEFADDLGRVDWGLVQTGDVLLLEEGPETLRFKPGKWVVARKRWMFWAENDMVAVSIRPTNWWYVFLMFVAARWAWTRHRLRFRKLDLITLKGLRRQLWRQSIIIPKIFRHWPYLDDRFEVKRMEERA